MLFHQLENCTKIGAKPHFWTLPDRIRRPVRPNAGGSEAWSDGELRAQFGPRRLDRGGQREDRGEGRNNPPGSGVLVSECGFPARRDSRWSVLVLYSG
jgi:hypothetical protein